MEQKLQDEQVCLSSMFLVSLSFGFHSYSPSRLDTLPCPLLEKDDLTGLYLHWVEMYMVGAKGPRAYEAVPAGSCIIPVLFEPITSY